MATKFRLRNSYGKIYSRVILRPVLWCSQPQIKIASAFLFLGVKKRSVAGGFSFFIRLLRIEPPVMEPGRESRPGLRIAAADSRLGC